MILIIDGCLEQVCTLIGKQVTVKERNSDFDDIADVYKCLGSTYAQRSLSNHLSEAAKKFSIFFSGPATEFQKTVFFLSGKALTPPPSPQY